MDFIEQIINGLSTGSMYALVAVGYTMVYGIAKMINFAHGEIIMVGAYITYACMSVFGLPMILAVILSIIGCALLGIVTERVAYRPLRGSGSLAVLITAIGVSYLLQNLFLIIFGSASLTFPKNNSIWNNSFRCYFHVICNNCNISNYSNINGIITLLYQ